MNAQIVVKHLPVHKVVVIKDHAVILACGKWLEKERISETTENVTCKACLVAISKE